MDDLERVPGGRIKLQVGGNLDTVVIAVDDARHPELASAEIQQRDVEVPRVVIARDDAGLQRPAGQPEPGGDRDVQERLARRDRHRVPPPPRRCRQVRQVPVGAFAPHQEPPGLGQSHRRQRESGRRGAGRLGVKSPHRALVWTHGRHGGGQADDGRRDGGAYSEHLHR
jgi:hypothetical protein